MEWGTVSTASMAGMVFSLLVSTGLPVALVFLIRRKYKAQIQALFVGAGTFLFFAMILEQLLHSVVFSVAGVALTSSTFLYALYGGAAAALFEETGRYLAMRFFMKNNLNRENALMYGVGHGGVESIMLMSMVSINNLATAALINSGGITEAMAQLDTATAQLTFEQLRGLWQTPSYLFYMGGLERVSALALQIGLSLLVFRAVKNGQKGCLGLAYGLHFLIDFLTVIVADFLPTLAVELILITASAAVLWAAVRKCWEEKPHL